MCDTGRQRSRGEKGRIGRTVATWRTLGDDGLILEDEPAGQVFPGNRSPRGQGGRGRISRTVATWRTMEDDGPILGDKPAQSVLLGSRSLRGHGGRGRRFGGLLEDSSQLWGTKKDKNQH